MILHFATRKLRRGFLRGRIFSTRIRRRTSRLRAGFPVFDGVGLAFNGSGKGLRSERSLHGDAKRRTGRVIGSGQGVAVSSFGVWGAFLWGRRRVGGGGCPRRLVRSPGSLWDLPSPFPDRRDEIDPGVDAGPAKDLIDAVFDSVGRSGDAGVRC